MEPRWKESLDRRMEPVTLTEEARERILLQANQTKGASKMKSRRRVILVAAVLAALCAGAATAAGIMDMIRQSITSAEQEVGSTTLALSQSDAGYTIKLNSLMGDEQNVYLLGEMVREDGQPLKTDSLSAPEYPAFRGVAADLNLETCEFPGQDTAESWGWSTMALSDDQPEDNRVEFVIQLQSGTMPMDGEANLVIDELMFAADGIEQRVPGHWAFTVPLKREAFGETLQVDLQIPLSGGTLTLKSIYCGAMDMRTTWDDPNDLISSDLLGNIKLVTINGYRIPYRSYFGDTIEFAPFNLGLGHLAPTDLAAIEVNGQSYPLTTGK